MKIHTIDLSDVTLEDESSSGQIEELQQYELGEIVEVEDEGPGIIAAFVEEPFEFPVGGSADEVETVDEEEDVEMEEIDASEENPVYIVALQDGGSVATSAEHISSGSLEDDDGRDISSWDDIEDDADEAELADVYDYCDNPHDAAELESAKVKMIHERQAAILADYVEENDVSLAELEDYSYEELQNIRGVDDPHIGFNRMPNGWTRKSVLQAWASLGGMWRTCYPRMVREFGPFRARRWCAALKDEVLRTERWRNRF